MTGGTSEGAGMRKFLVCVDDTPECRVALRFACRRAKKTGGGVTLLRVLEPPEDKHWIAVENLMQEEAREEAEVLLQSLAAEVNEWAELMPELVVREGSKRDEVLAQIEDDPGIRILVLGAAPGPPEGSPPMRPQSPAEHGHHSARTLSVGPICVTLPEARPANDIG